MWKDGKSKDFTMMQHNEIKNQLNSGIVYK